MREGKQQWGMRQPIILVFLIFVFVIKSQRDDATNLLSAEELRERMVALKFKSVSERLSICLLVYLFVLLSFIAVYFRLTFV